MGHSETRTHPSLTPSRIAIDVVGLCIFFAGILFLLTNAQSSSIIARVARVIDGDTIRVQFDGESHTVRLIREGYAHAYRRFAFSKRQEFVDLEQQARKRGLGLWSRR